MSNFLPSVQSLAKGAAATAAGLSTVGFGLLYYGQNYLIYPSAFPPGSRTDVPTPDQFGLAYDALELAAEDGTRLRCYLLVQTRELPQAGAVRVSGGEGLSDDEFAASRPTVVMFHGNGGNLGHRVPLARVFYLKMRCNVLMMCYRGYGLSEGSPSERGIKMDAQAGLDYILSHPALSKTPIILYGQSIGGAVSIDLASRNPLAIRALILENTFLSLPRLVPSALPVLGPFAFLCHQKWDSAAKVPLLPRRVPALLLSGAQDEVVPAAHMRGLWELLRRREGAPDAREPPPAGLVVPAGVPAPPAPAGSLSRFVEFEEGTHNDTCVQPGYWAAVAEFVQALEAEDARAAVEGESRL
ncbi:alpha/beta hydrolase [Phanerochaete sordida]|uniref:Alpha/beta hydrolase n=1 Tax=Phanerochaete sordida TaxID=48140 RepID=A0A9P3LEJ6_9APHY|nr:alpha/beta hydrolase [Phanerochaete sordida]